MGAGEPSVREQCATPDARRVQEMMRSRPRRARHRRVAAQSRPAEHTQLSQRSTPAQGEVTRSRAGLGSDSKSANMCSAQPASSWTRAESIPKTLDASRRRRDAHERCRAACKVASRNACSRSQTHRTSILAASDSTAIVDELESSSTTFGPPARDRRNCEVQQGVQVEGCDGQDRTWTGALRRRA